MSSRAQQRPARDRRQITSRYAIVPTIAYVSYAAYSGSTLQLTLNPNSLGWYQTDILAFVLQRTGNGPVSQAQSGADVTLTYAVPLLPGDVFTLAAYSRALTDQFGALIAPGQVVIPIVPDPIPQFDWYAQIVDANTIRVHPTDDGQTLYTTAAAEWITETGEISANGAMSTIGVSGITLQFPADISSQTGLAFTGTTWHCWGSYGNLIIPGTRDLT